MQFLLVLCFSFLVILVSLSSPNKLQILQSHNFLSLLICKCFVFMKTKDTIVKDKFSKKLELFHSPFSQLFSE